MSLSFQEQHSAKAHLVRPSIPWHELPTVNNEVNIERSVIACFEESVRNHPERIVLRMGSRTLTYAEFNRRVNQLAHAILDKRGAGQEAIFIIMDLSIEAIVAIFAILKAGKFYSAPDLKHPPERLALMLDNGDPPLLITNNQRLDLAQKLAGKVRELVNVDSLPTNFPTTNPPLLTVPESLYYIAYTSGTTGIPKGNYCNHRAVLHNAFEIARLVSVQKDDIMGTFRYPGFTPGYMLSPLFCGAQLSLFDGQNGDISQMLDWLRRDKIQITTFPMGLLRALLQQMPDDITLPALRQISAGSEAVQPSDVDLIERRLDAKCVFRCAYGLTETLGGCVDYIIDANTKEYGNRLPAGFPRSGFEVLLLDDNHQPVPTGGTGEIALRSRYLTLGYWRQPQFSAERFLLDPTDPEQTIFLTGDLGRFDSNGQLFHLGRKDDQVKIRGYRVEPIEIERELMAIGLFREVVVMARPNQHEELILVAWLVAASSAPPTISEIRQMLSRTLPDYMIPSAYVMLDRLPRTPAEKVDRKALPDPTLMRPEVSSHYRNANDVLEAWLVRCWENVLGIQPIGVDDDFFELGGDSLQAMRIVSRLREKFDDFLYVATLFHHPTIARFAQALCSAYPDSVYSHFGLALTNNRSPAEATSESGELEQLQQLRQHFATSYNRNPSSDSSASANPPAIFILAPGRSGTTLLRVMLGGHPQLFSPPELFLLEHDSVCQWKEAASGGRGYRVEGVLQALMQIHGCTLVEAERKIESYLSEDRSTQQLYFELQSAIAPRILVDKTPSYVHSINVLRMAEREFQDPLYLHLVRHPNAVIQSFEEVRFGERNPLLNQLGIPSRVYAEWNWLIAHQNILTFLGEVPPRRWHRLQFETLVKSPRQTMEQVCSFLGIPFDEAMLDPYRNPGERMTDNIHALTSMAGDPKFHQHKAIDHSVADKWQRNQNQIHLSEQTCQMVESLGYPKEQRESPEQRHLHSILNEIEQISNEQAAFME